MTDVTVDFELRAHEVLRQALGYDAAFRDQQLEAISAVVNHGQRLLVVQRTGWGKSAVYFVATRLLRDAGAGPSIIISPLLALMRDQIAAADRLGLRAETINSSNVSDWSRVEDALHDDTIDLLLISPERLNNPDFRDRLLGPLADKAGLLVIDEAHCISDWGHDFRPDYRRLVRVLELMPSGVPVLCTTATANDRVIGDIGQQLGAGLSVLRGPLDRKSLSLHVLTIDSQAERLAWLAQWLPQIEGSGIVYCLTVADTQRVADWLNTRGISAIAYSGESDPGHRIEVEQKLKANDVKVVAATSALGMGFDKPDLAFVIHYQSPDSPVAYYQQVGRAGRAVEHAEVVLLVGHEDADIWQYFLDTSLPVQWHAEAVVGALADRADWVSQRDLENHVNIKTARLGGLLKVLEVEGAVEKQRGRYRRTLRPWTFDVERVGRVREARLSEQQAMRDYAAISSCRMSYLRDMLDDRGSAPCGRCDNCTAPRYEVDLPRPLVLAALEFLRQRPIVLEPRLRWPGGPRSGSIATAERLQVGRALAYVSDAGWGRDLREARRGNATLGPELVRAAAALIRGWLPEPPAAVVYVPADDPQRVLVADLAQRLSEELGVPLHDCLRKAHRTPPQTTMENSAQQLANIYDAYEVSGPVPVGPVLLVDDIVGSRWTMTRLGSLLGEGGAGPIYPFAVARTKG